RRDERREARPLADTLRGSGRRRRAEHGLRARERLVEADERAEALLDGVDREVERAPVVGGEEEEAHRLSGHERRDLADAEDVADRLRHLLRVQADEAVVEERPDERLAARALGLRDLVLVV